MSVQPEPQRVGPDELVELAGPPEIRRREAFAGPGLWAGLASTTPGLVSGWHHHDGNDTIVYVLSGRLRIDAAEGGSVEAGPGDFLLVPRGLVHREATPEGESAETVVVRFGGEGPATVEVDPPS